MTFGGLLILLFISTTLLFIKTRKSRGKVDWLNMPSRQLFILSIVFASGIQFLIVTIIPGWLIALTILGYESTPTPFEDVVFNLFTLITNLILYSSIFFLLIRCFHRLIIKNTINSALNQGSVIKK